MVVLVLVLVIVLVFVLVIVLVLVIVVPTFPLEMLTVYFIRRQGFSSWAVPRCRSIPLPIKTVPFQVDDVASGLPYILHYI